MNVLVSDCCDPAENLALESYLRAESGKDHLLFYIDRAAVVIGRNQCPEAEADLEFCRGAEIAVVRRTSGGGAVYHDAGNINYAFITWSANIAEVRALSLGTMIRVLARCGVGATEGMRGELLLGGRKISGTASATRSGRTLFHGTLLYDTDLTVLQRALKGDGSWRGRKIASVPSPIVNISAATGLKTSAREFMDHLAAVAAEILGSTVRKVETGEPLRRYLLRRYAPEVIVAGRE